MNRRITIIDGHPDPDPTRLVHALAQAYADGAREAGHEICLLRIADLGIAPLQSQAQWRSPAPPDAVREAQEAITWCNQLLIVHPLWLGTMPAALKAFFEQVLRPGFAVEEGSFGWKKKLGGRSAHVVVTMGMPAPLYRLFFRAHGVRGMIRNILRFTGIGPVRTTLIGNVGHSDKLDDWVATLKQWGARGH